MIAKSPIGIFDSGVGGLTVFKEIRQSFLNEDIVYFGDTARVPYGTKSRETVIEYSKQNARFLINKNVKVIVVACNTSSAFALTDLQKITKIPVIGVIKAGAETAIKSTKNGKIGIIGTVGTVKSHAYKKTIEEIDKKSSEKIKNLEIIEKACPLFVPLAEEGWHDHHITKQVAEIYLKEILEAGIDTLVLGCTHYPILKEIIRDVCGESIQLIDSAQAVTNELKKIIKTEETMGKDGDNNYHNDFFVSDYEDKFEFITRNILEIQNFSLSRVQLIKEDFREI
ncbi:MAG: glutamate racemase [Candidatus Cloacimonetes bacterium]|nr:glutamate racemase [Candidatus Cloacimonadota bacterium]